MDAAEGLIQAARTVPPEDARKLAATLNAWETLGTTQKEALLALLRARGSEAR